MNSEGGEGGGERNDEGERPRKMKIGWRDKCKDCKEVMMKIETEWGEMFSLCVCVCT